MAFIFILMKNGCLVTKFYEFIVKYVWKFFSYQYMLETAVWKLKNYFKKFQKYFQNFFSMRVSAPEAWKYGC